MTTLVTGADGLLGSHLVRELLKRGESVRAMVLAGSDSPASEGLPVERVVGDVLDSESLRRCSEGVDRVVHCAALTDLRAPADRHWSVNLEGTRHVAQVCLERGLRLLFVGSASSFEYGDLDHLGDEQGGLPRAYQGMAYMESKRAAMELVTDFVANRGLNATTVAPTFLLGDNDWRPSSGELICQYIRRELPFVPSGGRNFAYAADVAAGAITALERGEVGGCYILGGHNLTYLAFFTLVAEVAGVSAPIAVAPAGVIHAAGRLGDILGRFGRTTRLDGAMADVAVLKTYYSSEKARTQLGMPQTPTRDAIAATLRGLRAFGHLPADPLEGKVALISGASRGVGFACARALASRGVKVVITARGERRLFESEQILAASGADVRAVAGDVGRWTDAQAMVATAIDEFGRLDLLINNAGVSMRGSFEELSPEVCAETINTNLLGPIYLSRAAAEHIKAQSGGILFVSSIAGLIGLPGASTYCASKSALTGLSESLRLELGPGGVHVGVVYLGFTEHDSEKRILSATGGALLPDRPAHQTQAQVADAIVGMMLDRKRQLVLTPIGQLGHIAHRLSPSLVESAIARAQASQWSVFKGFS